MKINHIIILLFLVSVNSFSQEIDGNKASQIYEVRGLAAAQVFSKINFAIALIYQNANDVIVFNDPDKKIKLESIVHPIVRDLMFESISKSTSVYSIIMVPLIFESQSMSSYDRILVVDCEELSLIYI